jgi:hypothetical protein
MFRQGYAVLELVHYLSVDVAGQILISENLPTTIDSEIGWHWTTT